MDIVCFVNVVRIVIWQLIGDFFLKYILSQLASIFVILFYSFRILFLLIVNFRLFLRIVQRVKTLEKYFFSIGRCPDFFPCFKIEGHKVSTNLAWFLGR